MSSRAPAPARIRTIPRVNPAPMPASPQWKTVEPAACGEDVDAASGSIGRPVAAETRSTPPWLVGCPRYSYGLFTAVVDTAAAETRATPPWLVGCPRYSYGLFTAACATGTPIAAAASASANASGR